MNEIYIKKPKGPKANFLKHLCGTFCHRFVTYMSQNISC